jgi:molybdopterin converting factor small subunit
MIVHVKLFAAARQQAGSEVIAINVEEPATVAALRAAIAWQYPQLAPVLRSALFAVNADYAGETAAIPRDAEVACIPPVSGG